MPLLLWLKAHWRHVAGLLLVLAAFAWGRFSAPVKTETRTVERVVYRDRVVEKRVEVAAAVKEKTHIVYRDRTVISKPDGTVTRNNIVITGDGTTASSVTTAATLKSSSESGSSSKDSLKTVDSRKSQWHVGVLASVSPLDPSPQLLGPVALGAIVERRIAGPVWVGVTGLSSGQVGAAVILEF